jgi:hypothetical protein
LQNRISKIPWWKIIILPLCHWSENHDLIYLIWKYVKIREISWEISYIY